MGPVVHARGASGPQNPESTRRGIVLDREATRRDTGCGVHGWGMQRALGKGQEGRYLIGSGG